MRAMAVHIRVRPIKGKIGCPPSALLRFAMASVFLIFAVEFPILSSRLSAQEPVMGGENLIGHVRLLKTLGAKVHLEWLYLEDRVDQLPEQQALIRSGRPLEFTEGFLYHGRDGLDDALLEGSVQGTSYLTRAPHVWAVGPFHEGSRSPAIFVVQALDFDRWRDSGAAVLEAAIDTSAGIMDPYPKVISEFPLSSVAEIWTDEDTGARYSRLLETPDHALSPGERRLKEAIRPWIEKGKFVVLRELHHSRLDRLNFFPAAYEIVGGYFVDRSLVDRIPRFRKRGGFRNSQVFRFPFESRGPHLFISVFFNSSTARSRTSSRPWRMPAIVGLTGTSG
jgi:hypothetical protein